LGIMTTMMLPREDRVVISSPFRAEPTAIWKARRFIKEHSDEELSLTKLASVVNISPNYLSEKFKEVTGIKFVEYVARVRVAKTRDGLQSSDLPITEIAFAAGFQSLSQFNRVFKKLLGVSPTEFRASVAKQNVAGR